MTSTLRVQTWNLWWRFGPWQARQPAIAAVLRAEAADVVCVQEVWAEEAGEHQAARLASELGYHWVAGRAQFYDGVAFTNAVLSRWPIRAHESAPLPRLDGSPSHRHLVAAEIESPAGVLRVISTHFEYPFDASAERVVQARALCEHVAGWRGDPKAELPVIVCGDLNATPDSDELRLLTGRSAPPVRGLVFTDAWEVAGDGSPGHTWRDENPYQSDAAWPRRRLDYVLVSWPRPKPAGNPVRARLAGLESVEGVVPSDHASVVVDVALP